MKNEKLVGEEKITLDKKSKKKIIWAVVAVVLALVIVVGGVLIKTNETTIYNKGLYLLMPKSLESESTLSNGENIVFYVRPNPDYDPEIQEKTPLYAFETYYIDENGDEVVFGPTETFEYEGEDTGAPIYAFLIKAVDELNHIKSIIGKCCIALAFVVVLVLIYVWFRVWSKKEDEKKALRIQKNGNNKKKK